MLQRIASRTARPALSNPQCTTCTCACGNVLAPLLPNSPDTTTTPRSQRRHYARPAPRGKRSPSTLRREGATDFMRKDPRIRDAQAQLQKLSETEFYRRSQERRARGDGPEPDVLVDFMNDFNELRSRAGGYGDVRLEAFNECMRNHGLSQRELFNAALDSSAVRVNDQDDGPLISEEQRSVARSLMRTLSFAGFLEATIRILSQMLEGTTVEGSGRRVVAIRGQEANALRGNLRKAIEAGDRDGVDVGRALVLEGKIAAELGDEVYAIGCLNRALGASVARSEVKLRERRAGIRKTETQPDVVQLSAPWYELALLHDQRAKRETDPQKQLAMWLEWQKAILVGVEQDDPICFYLAAHHELNYVSPGIYTSKWLYYAMKAAASGVVEAMHDIGIFYAKSRWPYLDDEPPDRLKPTSFDRHPAAGDNVTGTAPNILKGIKAFLGFDRTAEPDQESMDHVWSRALWPHTAEERIKLALSWLDTSHTRTYAPSALAKAQIYASPYLWASANAPKEALQQRNERYKFVSKAEWDRAPRHEKGRVFADVASTTYSEMTSPPADQQVPNSQFDEARAKELLREVVMAAHAVADRRQRVVAYRSQVRREGRSSWDSLKGALRDKTPEDYQKWFVFPEVSELWEQDAEALYDHAVAACNEKGWDLYDYQGNLLVQSEKAPEVEGNAVRTAGP